MVPISRFRFRSMRRKIHLPQRTIARWFGVAIGTINRWETGKTKIDPSAKILLWLLYDEQVNGNRHAVRDYRATFKQ